MNGVNPARVPIGQTEGGQYTGLDRSEAGISLELSDEEHNRAGTFLFPPRARSASQTIAFWSRCDVDDSVLENISLGYERWAHEWSESEVSEWLATTYYPSVRINTYKGHANEISLTEIAAREHAVAEYKAQVLSRQHPMKIKTIDARPIAIACRMYDNSGGLSAEDHEAILNHPIELRDGPTTVRQIVHLYQLEHIRPFFAGSTRAIVETLDQIRLEAERRG